MSACACAHCMCACACACPGVHVHVHVHAHAHGHARAHAQAERSNQDDHVEAMSQSVVELRNKMLQDRRNGCDHRLGHGHEHGHEHGHGRADMDVNTMLQARRAVADDAQTLDRTEEQIDANRAQLGMINERLRQQIQRMQGSTCLVWIMLLLVFLIFIGMYLFMKIVPKPRVR